MKLPIYYTPKDVIKQVWDFEQIKIELPVEDDLFKLSWQEVFKDKTLHNKTNVISAMKVAIIAHLANTMVALAAIYP